MTTVLEAVGIRPGQQGYRNLRRRRAELGRRSVRVRPLACGLCPTDKAVQSGSWLCETPSGFDDIVTGHEVVLKVEEVGDDVRQFAPGNLANLIVRIPREFPADGSFGQRVDMHPAPLVPYLKKTDWLEHGIGGADGGLMQEMVLDERCLARLPDGFPVDIAPLVEPAAALHKLIQKGELSHLAAMFTSVDEMCEVIRAGGDARHRGNNELTHNKALVTGPTGGAGFVACLLLTQLGFETYAVGRRPENDANVRRIKGLGVRYFQNPSPVDHVDWMKHIGQISAEAGIATDTFGFGGFRYILDITGNETWRTYYGAFLLGATGVLLDFAIPDKEHFDPKLDLSIAIRNRTVNNLIAQGSVNFNPADVGAAVKLLLKALETQRAVVESAIFKIDGLNVSAIQAAVNDPSITKAIVFPNGLTK